MNIKKAYEASNFIKEITKLENKIKWLNEFIEKSNSFDKGELALRTIDGCYYNILLEEEYELTELTEIILNYYNDKKDSLLKTIEKL